ncbi:Hypothetical protein PHPALM_11012 [Phytophthora palmivora]|uniref:Reverse transcriptase Ty1/copia-type domain-containing protein n=1 Tax=Phytophthora palmivora TaxID=4796 RepID=A0A2P4Y393_9STRA|nr:Hypothetical protein PHPALM_11012 [Phytophthora palmivora]
MLMEPQSVQEALPAPDAEKWKKALEKEYKDLMRNNTWELVERPKNEKVLTSKWVFVRKKDAQGNVVRHRTRITIKGCQQRYGVNYWETYAPVVAQESVKFILLLALHLALSARHVDFVTAFLNGPIGEGVDIYMEMPEYFDDGSGRVFYVDDLIIVGTDENIELVLRELRAKFEIKDLGAVTDLLHMEVSYIPGEMLWMSQRGYIDKVLKRFGMEDCQPVATPQSLGDLPEPADEHDPGVNDPNIPYRELENT